MRGDAAVREIALQLSDAGLARNVRVKGTTHGAPRQLGSQQRPNPDE
jgi:hypothetical protein